MPDYQKMIVDSFAGGGGASTGIEMALGRSPDVAINHSERALALHAANHPDTLHIDSNIWDVDPLEVTGGRRWGSCGQARIASISRKRRAARCGIAISAIWRGS